MTLFSDAPLNLKVIDWFAAISDAVTTSSIVMLGNPSSSLIVKVPLPSATDAFATEDRLTIIVSLGSSTAS